MWSGSLDYRASPIWFGSPHLSVNVRRLYQIIIMSYDYCNWSLCSCVGWGRWPAVSPATSQYSAQPSRHAQAFRPGLILTRLIFRTETEAAVHIIITQVWDLVFCLGSLLWQRKHSVFSSCKKNKKKWNSTSRAPFLVILNQTCIWFLLMWQLCELCVRFSPTEHPDITVTSLFINYQQCWTKPNMEDLIDDDLETGGCKFNILYMRRCFN